MRRRFATPRRLALHIAGLPARQPDTREERKGPRVGAPEARIAGLSESAGLASHRRRDASRRIPKKGEFYVAVIERPGRDDARVLAEILPADHPELPLAEVDALGRGLGAPDALRWVRPLHSILATFGPETEEPDIVPFTVGGIDAGDVTHGHRFMAPERVQGAPLRRLRAGARARQGGARCRRGAATSSCTTRETSRLAQGLELVEDEACCTRSPASSNGRSC